MPEQAWKPTAVGELFMLVAPNGRKQLMRVTSIEGPEKWDATSATVDDALGLNELPPEVLFP